jgi:hypothetical protein
LLTPAAFQSALSPCIGQIKKLQVERNEKGLEGKRNNSWIKKSKGDHRFLQSLKWAPSFPSFDNQHLENGFLSSPCSSLSSISLSCSSIDDLPIRAGGGGVGRVARSEDTEKSWCSLLCSSNCLAVLKLTLYIKDNKMARKRDNGWEKWKKPLHMNS